MKRCLLFCITIMSLMAASVKAQDSYNDRVKKYVEQYHDLALAEQRISGIPACITLGQGILETEAGASELMTEANNHFGIKCNSKWSGLTFTHTDDAPDECFKKYSCAAESYHDHSSHLKTNPRYAPLFHLSTTDYAAWAVCLKKCGYATNPQYAQRLIKIIEDFELQKYTYFAMDSNLSSSYEDRPLAAVPAKDTTPLIVAANKMAATPDQLTPAIAEIKDTAAPVQPAYVDTTDIATSDSSAEDTSKITRLNGMKAFYARKGEMLLGYAVKYNTRYPKLLEMNDLKDAPLPYDMYVYLEKKMTTGTHATHEVITGENMLLISQNEGIQLKRLAALNLLYPNEEPAVGTVLQLQKQAAKRPEALTAAVTAHKTNAILANGDVNAEPAGDYINIAKPTPAAAAIKENNIGDVQETATQPIDYATQAVPVHTASKAPKADKNAKTKQEDLSYLKADLDKVVYADDSKLETKPGKKAALKDHVPAEERTSTADAKYYTIKKGETAFSIAKRNNITVDQLYKLNHIDASGIKAGKTIRVQ